MPWERDGKVKLYPLQSTFPQHQLRHAGKLAVFGCCCCCCLHHPKLKLKITHIIPQDQRKWGANQQKYLNVQKKFVVCTAHPLFNDFGQYTEIENKICSQTIFDLQNSMVAFPKSQDEAVTSSFWPHLRKFKIPPDGIMLEQNPLKVHIEIHQGLHFCCKLKNFLFKILGTCPS